VVVAPSCRHRRNQLRRETVAVQYSTAHGPDFQALVVPTVPELFDFSCSSPISAPFRMTPVLHGTRSAGLSARAVHTPRRAVRVSSQRALARQAACLLTEAVAYEHCVVRFQVRDMNPTCRHRPRKTSTSARAVSSRMTQRSIHRKLS
jgi:hypothetical protein